jgi:hypothetical protein
VKGLTSFISAVAAIWEANQSLSAPIPGTANEIKGLVDAAKACVPDRNILIFSGFEPILQSNDRIGAHGRGCMVAKRYIWFMM